MGELAIVIVYIIIAGIVAMNRMANQAGKKAKEEENDPFEPMPMEPREKRHEPPRPKPMQTSTVETQSRRKTLKKRPQSMPAPPVETRKPRPEPVAPPPPKEEDPYQPLREVMKELFGAEDPVIVEEPPKPRPKKKHKPKPKPPASKIEERTPKPQPAMTAKSHQPRGYFAQLAKEAEENPFRAAIIYSEVLGKPKGLRNQNPFLNR